MEKKIITISREFGSGGRTIGREVANRLGIPFYDKELVEQIALESGFAPKFVEENGEHSAAEVVAGETGCKVYALDMGMGKADYFTAMRQNIDTIKEALS